MTREQAILLLTTIAFLNGDATVDELRREAVKLQTYDNAAIKAALAIAEDEYEACRAALVPEEKLS